MPSPWREVPAGDRQWRRQDFSRRPDRYVCRQVPTHRRRFHGLFQSSGMAAPPDIWGEPAEAKDDGIPRQTSLVFLMETERRENFKGSSANQKEFSPAFNFGSMFQDISPLVLEATQSRNSSSSPPGKPLGRMPLIRLFWLSKYYPC